MAARYSVDMSGLLPVQLRRAARPVTHDRVPVGRRGALASRASAECACMSSTSLTDPTRACTATYLCYMSVLHIFAHVRALDAQLVGVLAHDQHV